MLPSLVAEDLRASLTSFLGTTFALGDDDVRAELERFVADPGHGVFRGPFVRLRLPFRPADEGWREYLDWSPRGFRPHRHQARPGYGWPPGTGHPPAHVGHHRDGFRQDRSWFLRRCR